MSTAGNTGGGRQDAALRAIAAIGANVTVITALLVYFGWQRSETQNRDLGFDQSVLGMTTQDYLLRSVGPLLPALGMSALVGLAWLQVHRALMVRVQRGEPLDRVAWFAWGLRLTWLLVPLAAVAVAWSWADGGYLLVPMSVGVGTLLTAYGTHLRGEVTAARGEGREAPPASHSSLTRLLVTVVVLISVFWTASNYAELLGSRLAAGMADQLHDQPSVVVYSEQRLWIDAPGVAEEPLGGDETAYRYRYIGLRFMEHTGGQYFLLSDGWTPEYGVIVMLADDDPVRLEFLRDRR